MSTRTSSTLGLIVLAVGVVIAGFFIGRMHLIGVKHDRVVSVKGLAEREVDADIAIWPLNITAASNDLNTLQTKLQDDTKALKDFLQLQGFGSEELSIGFPNIQDTRALSYGGNMNSQQMRYIAKTEFTIRTSDITKLHGAMTELPSLIGSGLVIEAKNQWQPVEYLYTKLNDIKPEMVEEATKNAREVAEKFARDSGSGVGKIKTARQGIFTISDRDVNTGYIKQVRIVTTIDFFLED